jgi:serine/threonine protein kinase
MTETTGTRRKEDTVTPEQFEIVEAIFAAACEIPSAERESFIEQRCEGDGLVYREVMAFLDADDDAEESQDEGALSNAAWPAAADVTQIDATSPDVVNTSIPERIGRYRILRECGRGGMGVVYEAEQESPSRRVALKVIRTGVVSGELLRRFRNEAEVLGRLQHPGIAQIFEAGSFDVGDGGQPFFAMEYVDGTELPRYASDQALDTNARLALFTRICDAVQYAHEQGVIHRDLKPDNVLVVGPAGATTGAGTSKLGVDTAGSGTGSRLVGTGRPKVLDFGVARMTDSDVAVTTMNTVVGQIIGTLQYMSPEQASGDSRELDARSDVYALGVMLFELLGECLPYDLRNRSLPESVRVIQEEEPKRLSSIHHVFHGDLETIVGKCLEKEPDRRYQSAAALAEDIQRHLRDEPILALRPSSWYQIKKFARRNRALVGGVLATVVALVIGLVLTSRFAFRANELAETTQRQAYIARVSAAAALIDSAPNLARTQLEAAPEAMRGWEWRHLDTRFERAVRIYEADTPTTGPIVHIRGGAQLVSALTDGRVAIWDTESAELVRVGTGLAGASVHRIDAPSDGPPLIACGTLDGRVRVWDLDADQWFDVSTQGGPIREVVWDRTGERLLFAADHAVHHWQRGQPLRVHEIEPIPRAHLPMMLGFSSDGSWYTASTASQNAGEFFWWASETGEPIDSPPKPFDYPDGSTRSTYVSPDGSWMPNGPHVRSQDAKRLAVPGAGGPRSCVIMNALTPEAQHVLRGHQDYVVHAAWTPDDTRLVTSSDDGTIRLWDTATGDSLAALDADRQTPLAMTPDGSGVVFRADGTLGLLVGVDDRRPSRRELRVQPRVLRGRVEPRRDVGLLHERDAHRSAHRPGRTDDRPQRGLGTGSRRRDPPPRTNAVRRGLLARRNSTRRRLGDPRPQLGRGRAPAARRVDRGTSEGGQLVRTVQPRDPGDRPWNDSLGEP